jgi:hypothetical protein
MSYDDLQHFLKAANQIFFAGVTLRFDGEKGV